MDQWYLTKATLYCTSVYTLSFISDSMNPTEQTFREAAKITVRHALLGQRLKSSSNKGENRDDPQYCIIRAEIKPHPVFWDFRTVL